MLHIALRNGTRPPQCLSLPSEISEYVRLHQSIPQYSLASDLSFNPCKAGQTWHRLYHALNVAAPQAQLVAVVMPRHVQHIKSKTSEAHI